MPLSDDERYLAENCYGFGRWDANHWFIGPEQGESKLEPEEESERIRRRAEAFRHCSVDGLCDCLEFHKRICVDCWHTVKAKTGRVTPQSTWKYHMLLLMAFKGEESSGKNERSEYQRTRFGMKNKYVGETCVIELSGLSGKSLSASSGRNKKRLHDDREILESIIEKRVDTIARNILENNPKSVGMYGFSHKNKRFYEKIAGSHLQVAVPKLVGKTVFLCDRHPLYTPNERWLQFGGQMRKEYELLLDRSISAGRSIRSDDFGEQNWHHCCEEY